MRIHPVPRCACKSVTVCAQVHISNVSLKLHTGVSETSRHQTDNSLHHSLRILKDIAVALSGGLGEEKQDLTRKATSGLKHPVHCGNFSFPREQRAAMMGRKKHLTSPSLVVLICEMGPAGVPSVRMGEYS